MEMTNDHFFILIADSGKQKTKNSLEVVKNKLQKRKKKKKDNQKKKPKNKNERPENTCSCVVADKFL